MKVFLLGATGRTGKHILEILLNKEYSVNILVRNKNKVLAVADRMKIFEGDINKENLQDAMKGCEAIISVLNISRTSDFPWAKLRTPTNFLSETMTNILVAAKQAAIKRIIICTAWGVHETKKDIPGWFRWIIDNSNVGIAYKDHERQEGLLANSTFDYTIVRPAGLTNSVKERPVQISQDNNPRPTFMISRRNTAQFIVNLLQDNNYSRQIITISNKSRKQ